MPKPKNKKQSRQSKNTNLNKQIVDDNVDSLMDEWGAIQKKLGESKLTYYALQQAWTTMIEPHHSYVKRRITEGILDKLLKLKTKAEPITVESVEKQKKGYSFKFTEKRGELMKVDYFNEAVDDDLKKDMNFHEMDYRHPGTTEEYDEEVEFGYNDKMISPITTIAGQYITNITFAAPPDKNEYVNRFDMYPSYQLQLNIRTDDHRKFLYYDCFEHKPKRWDPETGLLPTNKEYKEAKKLLNFGNESDDDCPILDMYDKEDEKDDENNNFPVELEANSNLSELLEKKKGVKLCGHAGEFMSSRVYRIQVPLSNICGLRVHSPPNDVDNVSEDEDEDVDVTEASVFKMEEKSFKMNEPQSVLVLELQQPACNFAIRRVESKYMRDNKYKKIKDWSPHTVASRATRHYIVGNREEINAMASHLAPLLEIKLEVTKGGQENKNPKKRKVDNKQKKSSEDILKQTKKNSLEDEDIDLSVNAAPPAEAATDSAAVKRRKVSVEGEATSKKDKNIITKRAVHNQLKKKCGVTDVSSVSKCLKRAILVGHIKLDKGLKTVVTEGECFLCNSTLTCTVGDILYQKDYGGNDYEVGGEGASFFCYGRNDDDDDEDDDDDDDDDDDEDEACTGIFVTGMCYGDPSFDSGKFHNHCEECDDFGTCLGDYREAHCEDCGGHYYNGGWGYPCSSCGGALGYDGTTSPAIQARSDESVWNGWVQDYTREDYGLHTKNIFQQAFATGEIQ